MRVVVVDPSRTVLKFIARLLATRNHEVRTFVSAREALECVRSDLSVGALVTSDELLPMSDMSGIELCWEARLLATCRRPIYIILMSCDRDEHKVIEALDSGADDFIGKPPVAEELHARLRLRSRVGSEARNSPCCWRARIYLRRFASPRSCVSGSRACRCKRKTGGSS